MSFFSSVGSFLGSDAGSNLLRTGASLASAGANIYGSRQAAEATGDAAAQSTALQREIYRQNRADLAPYRAAGYGALDQQATLLGLGGPDEAAAREATPWMDYLERNPDKTLQDVVDYHRSRGTGRYQDYAEARNRNLTNRLRQLPGYQFRMDEGVEALDRSAAARGMALSGAQAKDLTEFGQGLADQTYGQQLNRLASLAGTGQTATTNTARMGSQFGSQAGRNALAAGDARASSYLTGARQVGNTLNNLAYIWG